MRISTLAYTFKQGFKNIFRNKTFTLASIATIGSCVFLFGLFYSVLLNFQNIVRELAERYHVNMPLEELYAEANKWELSHGGLSGRTASQFITHLMGTREDFTKI